MSTYLLFQQYVGYQLKQIKKNKDMKTEITITLGQARSWFRSGNKEFRELALQAFRKDALVGSFRDITTFKKACEVLGFNHDAMISDVTTVRLLC